MAPAEVTVYTTRCGERSMSRQLLRRAAEAYTGIPGCAPVVAVGEKGKPFFPEMPGIHFNITHSGNYWMCAFSSRKVGLDLQVCQPCDREKLSGRFFHPAEDAFLRKGNFGDFYRLWAAKESYLKYTGQGITCELESFSVVGEDGAFPAVPGVCLRFLPWETDYALCLCTEAAGDVQLTQLR